MQPLYQVPVIPCNLRHEETIVQIADTLNYLNNIFEDMFDRVVSRIEKNNKKMSEVMSRIDATSDKVEKLRGKKKATQIFSSSKYPAADIHKNYKSVFTKSDGKPVDFVKTQLKFKAPVIDEQAQDKLELYHVKIDTKSKRQVKNMSEGLGAIPSDIQSVEELFLFNTSKNPYKSYVMSDPLQTSLRTRKVSQDTGIAGPDAAPLSISQRTGLQRTVGDTYFYSPGIGNVPDIDVPMDLPDLPGVADDLQYLLELGPGIAPSVTTTPIVPDLPVIAQTPAPVAPEVIIKQESVPLPSLPLTAVPPADIPVPKAVREPAVEQPAVEEPVVDLPQLDDDIEPTVVLPQPPEMPVAPPVERPAPTPQFDMHASLMDAIRKVGGAKNLRTPNLSRVEKPKPVERVNPLMDDLHAKLRLRRKGISGARNPETASPDTGSVMDRLSAMIPAPSSSADLNESTNTEDDNWD